MSNIGQIGENFVAQWLKQEGYSILAQRWRSQRGEIDLIALSREILAFVEVKTRSPKNWDADGLLAITPLKQIKLSQTAALFLAKYPNLSNFMCRFDVALVKVAPPTSMGSSFEENIRQINLDQSVFYQGYQLTLLNYIESAFEQQGIY